MSRHSPKTRPATILNEKKGRKDEPSGLVRNASGYSLGNRTASITWMTPLLVMMSVLMTFAESTLTP